jgi:hypothetical protein
VRVLFSCEFLQRLMTLLTYFFAKNYFINCKKLNFSLYLILGFFTMPFDEKTLIVKWMAE